MLRLRALAVWAILPLAGCTGVGAASTDGPLPTPEEHGYGGLHVTEDQPFSDVFEVLVNEGDEPVRITSVELVDSPRQLRLVGAMVGGERSENHQLDAQFPPAIPALGRLIPAEGAVLEPVEVQEAEGALPGYVLAIGMEATEPGKWVRGGYRVNYEVDGRPYKLEVAAEVTVCTDDFLEADGSCPMEGS